MRLYDYAASANCLKVRILLGLLGTEYERVPVDIFAGESQTPEHVARNPAARVPVLALDSGDMIPESNAILVHLARGTRFLPDDPVAQSRVLGWLFFEQNLVEPNLGTARFWRLTGRDADREQVLARFAEAGSAALDILERHPDEREWLVGDAPTVADIGLYAYVHVAPDAGADLELRDAVRRWLARVEALPGFANDLEPYPPTARAGSGGRSLHGG